MICETCTAPSLDGPEGSTALHVAIRRHHEAREEGEDIVSVLMSLAKRLSLLEDAPDNYLEALFNKTDHKNRTVLSLAVLKNHLDVVELILKEDPAYERVPGSKNSDLMSLISIASKKGYQDIRKILCEKYGSSHIVLIDAIEGRNKELVCALLENDSHLAICETSDKWTALHYAVSYRFNTIIAAIITAQGDSYSGPFDAKVEKPLILAAKKGFTSTVILLIGLLPNQWSCLDVDDEGQNILQIAVVQSNKVMIQSILAYIPGFCLDKILNSQDKNGNTSLHLLISNGCFVPELIKEWRVSFTVRNNDKWIPYEMLYFQEEIIADQVQLKILLDGLAADSPTITEPSDNLESSVPSSVRLLKDIEFRIKMNEMMEKDHDQMKEQVKPYRERTGVQIVVTALITTVTFTVGFTMPGGYHQSGEAEEGLVLLSRKKAFQIFMVSDALALALSITSLFIYFISSMYDDPHQVSKFDAASTGLNIVSIMAMILTFIAGVYVVLSDLPGLALTVCVICSTFFLSIIVLLIKMIYDRKTRKKEKV